jgi:hypothetical protein
LTRHIFLLIAFLTISEICNSQTIDSTKSAFYDSLNKENLVNILYLKNNSSIQIFRGSDYELIKKQEVTYSFTTEFGTENLSKSLIKKTATTQGQIFPDIEDKTIGITVYNKLSSTDTFHFERKANAINLNDELQTDLRLWEIINYQCCNNPPEIELLNYNSQSSIFKCERNYFVYEFPDYKDKLILGYKSIYKGGKDSCIVGEINFSLNGLATKKILVKVRNKKLVEDIKDDLTKATIITPKNKEDYISRNGYCEKYYYEANNVKSFKDAIGIGIKIKFNIFIKGQLTEKNVTVTFDKGQVQQKEILLDW